jgi:peptide/nickel transport system permease protein
MLKILPKLGIRILSSLLTIFIVISLVFVALQLAPGEASYKYLSSDISQEALNNITNKTKSVDNLFEKYTEFISNILSWDFGYSLNYKKPVFEVIKPKLNFTIIFTFLAFSFQLIISFLLAYKSIQKPFGFFDKTLKSLTLISYSTPPFVSGLFLIYLFSYLLGVFPISGAYSTNHDDLNGFQQLLDLIKHMILPIMVFSLVEIPVYYNYLRENLRNIVSSTFILYLKSIGINERRIFWKHILPNALNSVIAVAGVEIGVMLGGSLIIEVVFGLPGMGRLIVSAISTNDYSLVIGCCLIASGIVIMAGLVSDILRIVIDKRLAKGLLN